MSVETNSLLGEKIDKLYELRMAKMQLNDKVKEIQRQFDRIQSELIGHMESEDIKAAKGNLASASITLGFYPSVKDLEEFTTWVVKNKKFEMMQKRVSAGAVKEMFDQENKLPPGTEAHTKPKLNLRKI